MPAKVRGGSRTLRPFFLALLVLACATSLCLGASSSAAPSRQAAPARVSLTLLATTDLHGNVFPIDYFFNQPANRGLAKIATIVKRIRAEQPHTLLLDCGDTIQGTPLVYYSAVKDRTAPNHAIAAMNALRYDAMAVGNHEFNFGLQTMWKAKSESRFPWLAANIRQGYEKGPGVFRPYVIREVAGIKVGIVGFVTPRIPDWELPQNYTGYEFEEIAAAARRVIPEVRAKVDVLVVLAHSGLGRDPNTGVPDAEDPLGENAVWDLAEQVPGIDVIVFGHTHSELPEKIIGNTLLVQPRNWGQSLARVDLALERDAAGRWQIAAKHSTTIPLTDDVPPDASILALARAQQDATQKYLDTPVGSLEKPIDAFTGRVEDHPLVDLIHRAQLDAGHADVSLATMFFPSFRYPAGPITIRHLYALYLYENSLFVVEMTGAQLREALERAAGFFPAWPPVGGQRLRLPSYSADSAEGVSYRMDLRMPIGQRIRDLTFAGQALAPDRKLRVALNNYRYAGGGRYAVFRGVPVLYRSPVEVRELLIEYVRRVPKIPPEANHNWEVVPAEARDALLREAQPRPPQARAAASAPSR